MRMPTKAGTAMRTAARIAVVAATLASLGACASIPQRAWANGQAMTESRAYRSVLGGNQSIQAHRELNASLNPRLLNYREVAYPAFGNWWY
jgi:hypothetical protein